MKHRFLLALLSTLAASSARLSAQPGPFICIDGVVRLHDGSPAVGAEVVHRSVCMATTRTAVTNGRGEFRIPLTWACPASNLTVRSCSDDRASAGLSFSSEQDERHFVELFLPRNASLLSRESSSVSRGHPRLPDPCSSPAVGFRFHSNADRLFGALWPTPQTAESFSGPRERPLWRGSNPACSGLRFAALARR